MPGWESGEISIGKGAFPLGHSPSHSLAVLFLPAGPPCPFTWAAEGRVLQGGSRDARGEGGPCPHPLASHKLGTPGFEPHGALGVGPDEGLPATASTRLSWWRWKSVSQSSVTCPIRVSPACSFIVRACWGRLSLSRGKQACAEGMLCHGYRREPGARLRQLAP